jgi:serine protease inhibitor
VPRVNRFGYRLLAQLLKETPAASVLVSPCGLAFALSLAYNGAAGPTRDEMSRLLESERIPLPRWNEQLRELRLRLEESRAGVQLLIANAVWGAQDVSFPADYMERVTAAYAAAIVTLDLSDASAVERINDWVTRATAGHIHTLLSREDLASQAACILTNAVYFKGLWSSPFDPRATREQPFYLPDGRQKPVAMMFRSMPCPYVETERFQAVELGYGDGAASMVLLLPREGIGPPALEMGHGDEWLPPFQERQVDLGCPRFSLDYERDLREPLIQLGAPLPFRSGADFAPMGLAGEYISQVKQRTRLEVNEEGSEAAASTAVVMGRSLSRAVAMVLDRPFLCAIRDGRTGVLVFVGVVVDPG